MSNLFNNAPNPSRLLVIAHDEFIEAITPLVEHKNRTGMSAHLVKLSEIVKGTADLSQHPWEIKKIIAEGHELHGTYYVMLVGDAGKIPTRHRFVRQPDPGSSGLDGTYNPTDFYYANLYRAGGRATGVFDWDDNKDGKYNEELWVGGTTQSNNPDKVEGFLEVAVGRIPAHTAEEVSNYVSKVIEYELGNRVRSINSFSFLSDNLLDGMGKTNNSIIVQSNIETLPNATIKRFLANNTNGLPPNKWENFNNELQERETFTSKWTIHIGHGYNAGWGIGLSDGRNINNDYVKNPVPEKWNVKYSYSFPIILSAGCETGQFLPNAGYTPDGVYRGLNPDKEHLIAYDAVNKKATDMGAPLTTWPVKVPIPNSYDFPNTTERTFAQAWLCSSQNGGAIAYSGATVTHQGGLFGGDLFLRFVRQIKNKNILGDIWAQAARDYLNDKLYLNTNFDVLGAPRIYLSIQNFYGDPSLRLTPVISYGISAMMANDRLTVFARTMHGTLTHKFYDTQKQKWTNWVHLGDGQISSGSNAIMANSRLTVFARTAHGTLTHKFYDTQKQKWTDWIHLESNFICSAPSAVFAGDRLTVFARDEKGRLTHRYYDTQQQGWIPWITLGEEFIASAPCAIISGDRLVVFAQDKNRELIHKYYDSAQQVWTSWIPLGKGQISSAPSAVMAGNRLTVFARTLHNTLTHKYYDTTNQQWTDWIHLGDGQISSAPSAVMAGNRLTVFARTLHNTLTHKYYDATKQLWTDWIHLGDGQIS
jgi:Peptidase family C25/Repeat of unknown function (DUF346)